MYESVSDILGARAREIDGVSRSMMMSFAIHLGLLATLALVPAAWFANHPPEKLMTISLGAGAVGPEMNGLTSLGGKKVEEVAPPAKRPEPVLPAAPKSTAMTEPIKAPIKPPAKASDAPSPPQVTPASKPVVGAQVSQGNAVAATTATGLGVGLSSGGLGGTSLDSNFCCPDWVDLMRSRINWRANLGIAGEVVMEFVVERDGTITNVKRVKSGGADVLDIDAQRALTYAQLPPLPAAYTPSRLTVTLTFPYIR